MDGGLYAQRGYQNYGNACWNMIAPHVPCQIYRASAFSCAVRRSSMYGRLQYGNYISSCTNVFHRSTYCGVRLPCKLVCYPRSELRYVYGRPQPRLI